MKTKMKNWQPIETAPKNGTDILLFYPCYNRKIWIGSYNKNQHFRNGKLESESEGWSIEKPLLSSLKSCNPTHWMPLPSVPNVKGQA
jgi:hypothetical protein